MLGIELSPVNPLGKLGDTVGWSERCAMGIKISAANDKKLGDNMSDAKGIAGTRLQGRQLV